MEIIANGPVDQIKGSLKFWRVYRNYTQQDLAKMSGVTTQTITNLEIGKYPISKSMKLALASILKIKEEQLLTPYEVKED